MFGPRIARMSEDERWRGSEEGQKRRADWDNSWRMIPSPRRMGLLIFQHTVRLN